MGLVLDLAGTEPRLPITIKYVDPTYQAGDWQMWAWIKDTAPTEPLKNMCLVLLSTNY